MDHYIVAPLSSEWFAGWGVLLGLGFLAIFILPRKIAPQSHRRFEIVWGVLLILSTSLEQITLMREGLWNMVYSLPLQLCSLSGLLVIFTLLTRNKWTYLFSLFWGISGGLHSFLTPEMTLGGEGLFFWTYHFWHASIIIAPLYFFLIQQWGVPKRSFLLVWGSTHLVWIAVGLIDWSLGANYMYVLAPPAVDNPFVQGVFPYHLIWFEIAGILHFGLLALLFTAWQRRFDPPSPLWSST